MANQKKGIHFPDFVKGMAVGATAGIASLIVYQYLRAILKQPRLLSRAVLSKAEDFDNHEAHGLFIAADNLRSAIETRHAHDRKKHRDILHAGYRNFRESWARDFGFASYGLLALKEFKVVKDTLEAFLENQTTDGQLPVKLHSMGVVTRFMHSILGREQSVEFPLRPKYLSGHGSPSLDGQCLMVISALRYARIAEDDAFLKTYWDALIQAVSWTEKSAREIDDGLLTQGPFADWADSIGRSGRVLYTNIVYWKALLEMSEAAKQLALPNETDHYTTKAERVAASIHDHLWRPELGFYAASNTLNQLSSSGNLLAVAWGLASEEQAISILDALILNGMASPVPTKAAYPNYPLRLVALENRLGGVPNYHTDAAWLWIGAWHVIALARAGRTEEAHGILARIADVIVRDKQVHEVYDSSGRPLSSFWYKSEAPLSWNAGMVVYAYHILEEHMRSKTDIVSMVSRETN